MKFNIESTTSYNSIHPAYDYTEQFASNAQIYNEGTKWFGIFLAFISGTFFTISAALVKAVRNVDPMILLIIRAILQMLVMAAVAIRASKNLFGPKDQRLLVHLQGIVGGMTLSLLYYSFRKLPLGDATTIIFSSPVIVIALSFIFLKEPCGLLRLIVVCALFTGVVFVARPPFIFQVHKTEPYNIVGYICALLATLFTALNIVVMRKCSEIHYSVVVFNLSSWSLITAVVFFFAVADGHEQKLKFPHDWVTWGLIVLVALTGLCGQGKKKVKSVSLTRITESVSYPRLVQTETKKKGYEGAKPVKIAELLGLEYSKRFQKESVKPKIQPERLGKRSSQQKKEKHEADRPDQPTATGRSVRRNLNFNEMCGNAQHNNNENFNMSKKVAVVKSASKKYPYNCSRKTLLLQSNTVEEKCLEEYNEKTKIRTSRIDSNSTKDINSQIRLNVIKENGNIQKNNNENNATKKVTALRSASKKHHNLNRESLLVQPNTVKDKYMSKCNAAMKRSKKFNVSQIDTNSKENLNSQNYPNAKRHTEKSKNVQSIAPTIMVTANTPIRESCLPMEHAKSSNEIRNIEFSEVSNVTKVNNVKTSQQANNTTVQVARENDTFPKIPVMSRKTLHDAEKEECIASENQEIQLSVQNEYKNQTPISTSSTMISVNREEIVNLECNLKHYICTVEENLSNLKSTLAYVTKLLSLEDAEKVRSNVGLENIREADLAPTIAKKVMVEKAVQVEEVKNDSAEPASPVSKTESAKGLEMTRSTPKTADNKENIEDGRAKQPCTKIYTGDDSFIELENQLDITHAENVAAKIIRRTPIIKKRETIGCERTLREYLLLKSNMSFLETPDIKKYRSRLNKTSNIDEHAALSKRFISSKILKDLQNLYSESPEC